MSKPVSLLGHAHVCPMVDPGPKPHVGGPVFSPGQSFVRYNGIPVAVEGGQCLCTGMPGQDGLAKGSSIVRINGKGLMRIGDATSHGGKLVAGVPGLTAD
jgi:uncharacterized Zn-binding protein involved in type VI secretion